MNISDPIFYRMLFYDFCQWTPRVEDRWIAQQCDGLWLNRLLSFQATEYTMKTVVQPCTLEWQSLVMQVEFSSWVHQVMAGHEFGDNVHYNDFLLWQIYILCELCHAASDAHDQVLMSAATKMGCWSIYVSFLGNMTSIVSSRQMDRSALW